MYEYVGGSPSNANHEAALFGICADSRWSYLIISDSLFKHYAGSFLGLYSDLSDAISFYQKELREITSQSIISGELHDSLVEFLSIFDSLADKLTQIGVSYKNLCVRFIAEAEEIDEDMYEAGCDPRDYSGRMMEYYLSLINDARSSFGKWLDNLINNTFEGLKDLFWSLPAKKIFGITYPDARYSKEFRQALLDKLNYDKEDILNIQKNELQLDRDYEVKFGNLYDAAMQIKTVIDEANDILGSGLSHNKIVDTLNVLKQIRIDTNEELKEEEITVDNVDQFCSKEENRSVFVDDFNELEKARNDLGVFEAVSSAVSEGLIIAELEIFKREVPDEIPAGSRYSYLLLKKQLSETVAEMAGNPPDISAYEKEQLINWVYKALNGDDSDIPEEYKHFLNLIIDSIKKNSKSADLVLDGLEEAILPLLYDYTANLKIIRSMGNGVDPKSTLGIAVKQLEQEYSEKFNAGLVNILSYVEKQIAKGVKKALKELVMDGVKACGGDISLYLMAAQKAAELSGINTIGNASEKLYSLHEANEQLLKAYQANFDIVASGNYSETDVENLKNSFHLLKNTYIEEYRVAAELAGAEGKHDLKRHYKECMKKLKNLTMESLLPEL